ncbi:MAG: hypothetical protein V7641_4577 [Blastocatellia bacterium]
MGFSKFWLSRQNEMDSSTAIEVLASHLNRVD